MCGFVGFIGGSSFAFENPTRLLKRMTDTLINRGPDEEGFWYEPNFNIGLGHRRLSVLDISPAGSQPMHSASKRYSLIFNGEIYNCLQLRKELNREVSNINWRGHSDTEIILAGFDAWGINKTIQKCQGMFAFAVFDKVELAVYLVRDRLGEKPLYYGWQGEGNSNTFLFGSELKALKQHPNFLGEINRDALSLFLRHNYIPAPYSIYKGIYKLLPGSILCLKVSKSEQGIMPEPVPYWSLLDVANKNASRLTVENNNIIDELETLLGSVIGQQMIADVPVGAFLSGGVDSSTIVSLMQSLSSRPINTFSIGFNDKNFNEAEYAKAIAKHLGTCHTELYVSSAEAMAVIPDLPTIYDEPFSDSSQIPTFLVSKLAKEHVTVSLSGDGGDELFCGYNRYQLGYNLWNKLRYVPLPLRQVFAKVIRSIPQHQWTKISKLLPGASQYPNFGDKLHKGAVLLNSETLDGLYMELVSHTINPTNIVLNSVEPPTLLTGLRPKIDGLDGIQQMMLLDSLTYLPDDILVKVDRASMGVSLESRMPFLNHRVVEFAWSMPQSMKIKDGISKWALRQVLYRHVPKKMIDRPKMGFGIPLSDWLRGPLREWAEFLLNEKRIKLEGYFEANSVRKMWKEHLTGKRNFQYQLWNILMFQAWLQDQNN